MYEGTDRLKAKEFCQERNEEVHGYCLPQWKTGVIEYMWDTVFFAFALSLFLSI